METIRLAMNYADPLGANDTAHARAKDGQLSVADLRFIAANFGNKDGKTVSTEKLLQAGFCHKDAVAIAVANQHHPFQNLTLSLGKAATVAVNTDYGAGGANDTAHARAADGLLTKADLRFIAETFGNKDGKTLSVVKLTQAGFTTADAKAIFAQYRVHRDLRDIALQTRDSTAAPPPARAVLTTTYADGSVNDTAHARAGKGRLTTDDLRFIAATFGNKDGQTLSAGKLTQAGFTPADAQAIMGQYHAHQRTLAPIDLTRPSVATAPPPAEKGFIESVADATTAFGKGFVDGIVDDVVEIGVAAKDFAVEHPYVTAAVVVGAAALVTVASGGVGGPVAAGVASGILTGLSYTGVAAGTVIAAYKAGDGINDLAHGRYEQAGEKFGGASVEAALTFGPGQVVKRLKTASQVAEFQAKELQAFGKLGDETNQILREMNATGQEFNQMAKAAPKLVRRGLKTLPTAPEVGTKGVWTGAHHAAERAEKLESLEKLAHDVHNYTGAGEMTTSKGKHAVHIVIGGGDHGESHPPHGDGHSSHRPE